MYGDMSYVEIYENMLTNAVKNMFKWEIDGREITQQQAEEIIAQLEKKRQEMHKEIRIKQKKAKSNKRKKGKK